MLYGLIGYPLSHSFSQKYFTEKFEKEHILSKYQNFEINSLEQFPQIIIENTNLIGLNVTIPYKEAILPYLNEIDQVAKQIGAVNTIKIVRNNGKPYLIGYNTDAIGFEMTLKNIDKFSKALIIGNGGAAKAIKYTLNKNNIDYIVVSRKTEQNSSKIISYDKITENIINEYSCIINTTPLGMFPNVKTYPNLPYKTITNKNIAYDLIYNPIETLFLERCRKQGATTINGMQMLINQAEASYLIFNNL